MTRSNKRTWKGLKQHGHGALRQHLLTVAHSAAERHGPQLTAAGLAALLQDRAVVRFPTYLEFEDAGVRPGTFAQTRADGWVGGQRTAVIQILEMFAGHPDLPLLVAYYIPTVNYGRMASGDDCLSFGAALLGLDEDTYHARLSALLDQTHG